MLEFLILYKNVPRQDEIEACLGLVSGKRSGRKLWLQGGKMGSLSDRRIGGLQMGRGGQLCTPFGNSLPVVLGARPATDPDVNLGLDTSVS